MAYVKNVDLLKGSKEWASFKRLHNKGNTLAVIHKDKSLAIRYYWTDIITWKRNGHIVLNSGGWLTPTTKDRINEYLKNPPGLRGWFADPLNVCINQRNNRWYIGTGNYHANNYKESLFHDGVVLTAYGEVINPMYIDKRQDRVLKQIEKYINKLSHMIRNRHLLDAQLLNTSGDCLFCQLRDDYGKVMSDNHHLMIHVKEGYIMGSLIYNALIYSGYRKEQLPYISSDFWNFKHIIIRSVRKYLKGELLGINKK